MDLLADDMERIHRDGALFGLHINNSKSEIIANSEPFSNGFANSGFQFTAPTAATLLGAPLSDGSALDSCLSKRYDAMARAITRLELIASHDALVLLKNSLSAPRLVFTLRTATCDGNPLILKIDELLRSAVSRICNVSLSDQQWSQAGLPTRLGGLVIRNVVSLALSAFIASVAATHDLQFRVIGKCIFNPSDRTLDYSLIE